MTRISARHGARRSLLLGEVTRGKTRPNRLRGVDAFLLRYAEPLIRREDGAWAGAWTVDLGYGAEPATTLEMARSLRRINPQARVLGVEIDAERVAAAQPFADALTEFRLGGFNLPLRTSPGGRPEHVRLIRAFNVLRQYDEPSVATAWAQMAQALLPGGLLVEGTSDPLGRLWVANVLRRVLPAADGADVAPLLHHEALVFGTSLKEPFDPTDLQAVLPKNLIHRVLPGEPIHAFFAAWLRAARAEVGRRAFGPRQWFVATAEALARDPGPHGWRIDTRRKWLRDGILIVRLPRASDP